jgi:hypothetical protein
MNQMKQRSHPASVTISLCALALYGAWMSAPAQARQSSPQQSTTLQSTTAQPTTAAPQQGAATRRQTQKTDQANRAAAVEDETSTAAQAARTAQSETAQFEAAQRRAGSAGAPSYGPVLAPRGQAQDPARKDPAEVHDETDSLTRPAADQPAQSAQPADPADPAGAQRRKPNPHLRRPAWQPATEPMAPRPLRPAIAVDSAAVAAAAAAAATAAVPVPIPAAPPRAQLPRPAVIGSCQGNSCLDTNGQRYNGLGTGAAGVNSSGRLCTRTGISVQCF